MDKNVDKRLVQVSPCAILDALCENVGTEDFPVLRYRSDVSILLYQKSVEQFDEVAFKDWLSAMGEKHPKIDFTDEQFLQTIRSRYIQSPQDVQYYLEGIERQTEQLLHQVEQTQQVEQAQQVEQNRSE